MVFPLQSGDAKITNHTVAGEEAHIKFHAYSYFSRERQRKVCDRLASWGGEGEVRGGGGPSPERGRERYMTGLHHGGERGR